MALKPTIDRQTREQLVGPELASEAPLQTVPAGSYAQQYPIVEGRPRDNLYNSAEAYQQVIDYAQKLFPDRSFELLSDEGSSAFILEDGAGLAYKVYRRASNYPYVEKEMAAMTLLADNDLAPKPYLLVDAALAHRRKPFPEPASLAEVPIVRQDGGGELPVIVYQKVEFDPLTAQTDPAIVLDGFDRLLAVAKAHNLMFGDVEPVVDRKNGKLKLIDVGGTHEVPANLRYVTDISGNMVKEQEPELSEAEYLQASQIKNILEKIMRGVRIPTTRQINDVLKAEGIDGIRSYVLHSEREQQSAVVIQQ